MSANPGGKARGPTLRGEIARLMASHELNGRPLAGGKTIQTLLAEVIVKEALKGKFPFVAEVWTRLEGKVADRLAGPDGGPLAPVAVAPPDLSRLSDLELVELRRLLSKMGPRDEGPDPTPGGAARATRSGPTTSG